MAGPNTLPTPEPIPQSYNLQVFYDPIDLCGLQQKSNIRALNTLAAAQMLQYERIFEWTGTSGHRFEIIELRDDPRLNPHGVLSTVGRGMFCLGEWFKHCRVEPPLFNRVEMITLFGKGGSLRHDYSIEANGFLLAIGSFAIPDSLEEPI